MPPVRDCRNPHTMSLTCEKVGEGSWSCCSRVSSHWSKRWWSCWRSTSHCLLARTSLKEITSAHPMGESSQMRLARACTHYREVPYGMSESPNAPNHEVTLADQRVDVLV